MIRFRNLNRLGLRSLVDSIILESEEELKTLAGAMNSEVISVKAKVNNEESIADNMVIRLITAEPIIVFLEKEGTERFFKSNKEDGFYAVRISIKKEEVVNGKFGLNIQRVAYSNPVFSFITPLFRHITELNFEFIPGLRLFIDTECVLSDDNCNFGKVDNMPPLASMLSTKHMVTGKSEMNSLENGLDKLSEDFMNEEAFEELLNKKSLKEEPEFTSTKDLLKEFIENISNKPKARHVFITTDSIYKIGKKFVNVVESDPNLNKKDLINLDIRFCVIQNWKQVKKALKLLSNEEFYVYIDKSWKIKGFNVGKLERISDELNIQYYARIKG